MHPTTAQPTRLLPRQTRLIHASTGVRLRLVSGRLWLTQPNAAQDLFLGPGATIDLLQDWVVIGADAEPGGLPGPCHSEYLLTPLVESARRRDWRAAVCRALRRLAGRATAARSVWSRSLAK